MSSSIALRALRRNRLQSVLTILSLMIGVATVLAMVAVGSGAERSITNQVRAAGMNILVVSSGNFNSARPWLSSQVEDPPANPVDNPAFRIEHEDPDILQGLGPATTLSSADAGVIASMPGVQAVSASVTENIPVKAGSSAWTPQIRGEQASLPKIRRAWNIPHGRFFTPEEEAQNAPVAVLGSVAARGLFGERNPVSEQITIRGESFRVVGVIASSSWLVPAFPGDGQFDAVYLPLGAAQHLLGRSYLDTITVSTASAGDVTKLNIAISAELRRRHALDETMATDFRVNSQADRIVARGLRGDLTRAMSGNVASLDEITLAQLSRTLETTGRTMSYLLASIAAVSLVVGGIGIMNVMMLAVTDRTREIGIRRAVGAQSHEVMQQFLIEAMMLSAGGGLLGIALGIGASAMIGHMVHWAVELTWISIVQTFAISAAIGILFGFYPARQAAKVVPMTALRYE
jgi:ABC-type antimicrobial peptide transport system permease subunit